MIGEIICYTDGSASVAGQMSGRGGFGTYFPNLFGRKRAFSLGFDNIKVGAAESLALLYAIRAMPKTYNESLKLVVYSDSEYICKTFTEGRLEKWRDNGWTNTSGEVKNKAIWIAVHQGLWERKYLQIELRHIRSHQVEKEKDPEKKANLLANIHIQGNLVVDALANYKRHEKRLNSIFDLSFMK